MGMFLSSFRWTEPAAGWVALPVVPGAVLVQKIAGAGLREDDPAFWLLALFIDLVLYWAIAFFAMLLRERWAARGTGKRHGNT